MGSTQRKRELRQTRLLAGLCGYCGKYAKEPNKVGCSQCLKRRCEISKTNKDKLRDNQLCPRCGQPSYNTYKLCQDCRRKEYEKKRKGFLEQGLCKTCGKHPIRKHDSTLCQICWDRLKTNRKIRAHKRRKLVINHYGGKCACCGETQFEFLTIDHKNNDGAKHKRALKSKDTSALCKWIIDNNFPDYLQVLCYNCNCAKGVYGSCPHSIRNS